MQELKIKNDSKLDPYDWPLLRASNYDEVIHITNEPDKWEIRLDATAFLAKEIKVGYIINVYKIRFAICTVGYYFCIF